MGSHHAATFRDEIAFGLVEQFEIGRTGPELGALVVRFLDPIINSLRIARLDGDCGAQRRQTAP